VIVGVAGAPPRQDARAYEVTPGIAVVVRQSGVDLGWI
jgi:hypothetical protein